MEEVAHTETQIKLRDYQTEPANQILDALAEPNANGLRATVLAVAPVGFGKTVLFSHIAADFVSRGMKVLIIAHRQELLDQIGEKIGLFGLASGLEKAASKVDERNLPSVTVASVQTLQRARLARFDRSAFGLIIIDEAHHAITPAYRAIVDHFFETPVLGVTGTPSRLDGEGLGVVFEKTPVVISLDQGIRSGWLCTPRLRTYHIVGYDLDSVKTVAGEFDAGDLERELLADPVLHAAVHIIQECAPGKRMLVFTPTVGSAERLSEELNRVGLRALAVSGSMTPADRKEATRRYRAGEVDIAVNCMLWTEGFDVPETDCVLLLRPTKSVALMTQMIGRGLRLHPGKTECLLAEIQAGTVKDKVFMSPDRILESALIAAKEDRGKFNKEGHVDEPEMPRVVESIKSKRTVKEKTYDELMGVSNDPNFPAWHQLEAVKNLGFDPKKITCKADVERCFEIVRQRRERGLCSVKIGKKLQQYGLNGGVSHADGAEAMSAIAANKWRPPPWMYRDARFAKRLSA